MSMPSPFELGRSVGGNISGGIRDSRERNSIDQILEQANASGQQEDIDQAMRSILSQVSPERQPMALQVLQQKQQQMAQQRQAQAYQEQGLNPNLPEGINREILKNKFTEGNKKAEDDADLRNAFNRTEEILKSGHTGFSGSGLGTAKGRQDRAELDTLSEVFLGKLIPILNPRGTITKERFKYMQSLIPNSSDTDAKFKGKLKALRQIFKMEGNQEGQYIDQKSQAIGESPQQAEKPPLDSFYR